MTHVPFFSSLIPNSPCTTQWPSLDNCSVPVLVYANPHTRRGHISGQTMYIMSPPLFPPLQTVSPRCHALMSSLVSGWTIKRPPHTPGNIPRLKLGRVGYTWFKRWSAPERWKCVIMSKPPDPYLVELAGEKPFT